MKKRVQFKLINEIKNQNWNTVAEMVKRKDIFLSSKGTDFENDFQIDHYAEPIYSFMAYSLTDRNLLSQQNFLKSIFEYFLENYHEKRFYMKAPLFEKKADYYSPLYYLESLFKRHIKSFPERYDLFKYYSKSLIALSKNIHDKETPSDYLSAKNKNHLTVPLYIEYYKQNNLLPPLSFLHKVFMHNIYEKNYALPEYNINIQTIEAAYPRLFSKSENTDKIISYFSTQFTSGEIALWIYKNTQKLTIHVKPENSEKFLLSLIPSILNSFSEKGISLNKEELSNIFSHHSQQKTNELYYIYPYSHYNGNAKVSIDDFIFHSLIYSYDKKESRLRTIIDSFIKHIFNETMFEDKLNPLEFLLGSKYQGNKITQPLSILYDYPDLFIRNKKNGKNFWHSLREIENIHLLNPFLKHGDIDNIDNQGNHAFSEITYYALQNQNKEVINWLSELLNTKTIKNMSGQYNNIPLTEMIKNSPVLIKAANIHYAQATPEIHTLCYFLKITDMVNILKKYDNIDVNQINSKNQTPLLLLLNSERDTQHAYTKKQKIYDLICNNINFDVKMKNNQEALTAIDIYVKEFKRGYVNLQKEKFIGHIIKNTTDFDNQLIGRYIADTYYAIAEHCRYADSEEYSKSILQFNQYIGFNNFSLALKSSIIESILDFTKAKHLDDNNGIKYYYLYFKKVLNLFNDIFPQLELENLISYKEKISDNCELIIPKLKNINDKDKLYVNNEEAITFFERVILDKEIKHSPVIIERMSTKRL